MDRAGRSADPFGKRGDLPHTYCIHLREDEDTTAWLKGLDFCLRDDNGKATERIRNGITATGGKYQQLPEGMFAEQFTLEDYPYDTATLSWAFTRTAIYEIPVIVVIK